MREQLDSLRDHVTQIRLDLHSVSKALDGLPPNMGVHSSILVGRARHHIAKLSSGRKQYMPLLRYTLRRLVVLLERSAVS